MESLKPYVILIEALAVLLFCGLIWFSGDRHGQGVVNARWNKERLATAQAVAAELERQKRQEAQHQAQLAAADARNADLLAKLAAVASTPVSHILCHRSPGSGAVPTVPASAGGEATGPGATGAVRGPDFDPAPDERRLHVAYAGALASCYDALNRWPN
jgi:hypothetical protein